MFIMFSPFSFCSYINSLVKRAQINAQVNQAYREEEILIKRKIIQ